MSVYYDNPLTLGEVEQRLAAAGWTSGRFNPATQAEMVRSQAWSPPGYVAGDEWDGFVLSERIDPPHPGLVEQIAERLGWAE